MKNIYFKKIKKQCNTNKYSKYKYYIKYIFLKYEVSILIWYIICVDIFINKTIIRVNAMKSDVLKIATNNNYVQLSQKSLKRIKNILIILFLIKIFPNILDLKYIIMIIIEYIANGICTSQNLR